MKSYFPAVFVAMHPKEAAGGRFCGFVRMYGKISGMRPFYSAWYLLYVIFCNKSRDYVETAGIDIVYFDWKK